LVIGGCARSPNSARELDGLAILSSATNHVAVMLQTVLARHAEAPAGLLEELLGLAVSTRKDGAIAEALDKVG